MYKHIFIYLLIINYQWKVSDFDQISVTNYYIGLYFDIVDKETVKIFPNLLKNFYKNKLSIYLNFSFNLWESLIVKTHFKIK